MYPIFDEYNPMAINLINTLDTNIVVSKPEQLDS